MKSLTPPPDYTLELLRSTHQMLVRHFQDRLMATRQRQAKVELNYGSRAVCPATLEDHVLVTFHSAPPAERLVCIDCGAQFRDDDAILTKPHGRSKL